MIDQDWYAGGWIQTFTGRKFYPLNPRIADICIEDIAHALSNICRYGGHCRSFYSVAQHCLMVSEYMTPWLQLEGLMHDASEAYLGDLTRPVKHSPALSLYREAEHRLEAMIADSFELMVTPEVTAIVKHHDNRALYTERKFILTHQPEWSHTGEPFPIAYLTAMSPEHAEEAFLERYFKLQRSRISL